jgi:hypothetical protein
MALKKKTGVSEREFFEADDDFLERDVHGDMARIYLIEPLRTHFSRCGIQAFVGGNSAVFYDTWRNPISPEIYVVNGGQWRRQSSWAVHEEGGLYPTFVMELLSPKTERRDRTTKKRKYRDTFKSPDYFMLDLYDNLEGYHLVQGNVHEAVYPRRKRSRPQSLMWKFAPEPYRPSRSSIWSEATCRQRDESPPQSPTRTSLSQRGA